MKTWRLPKVKQIEPEKREPFYTLYRFDRFNKTWTRCRKTCYHLHMAVKVYADTMCENPAIYQIKLVKVKSDKVQGLSHFPSDCSYKPAKEMIQSNYQEMTEKF